MEKIKRTDAEWRASLTPEQYRILREAGTEPPWSGKLLHVKDKGEFRCAACGEPLFSSESKYDSGSGWPSFTQPMSAKPSAKTRIAATAWCAPKSAARSARGISGMSFPTARARKEPRYCINSTSLAFTKADAEQ
jgi:Conserved domain frequently associated with peptide methionine sulfoxide reductase